MKSILVLPIAALLISVAFAADSRQTSSPPQPPTSQPLRVSTPQTSPPRPRINFSEHYGVLAERNIFLRDRSTRRPAERNGSTTQPTRRPIEESFTVTGIVLEEGLYRAYVEESGRPSALRLSPGDAVARGKVTRIEIDGIEYNQGETQTWVDIGSNLTSQRPTAAALDGLSGLDALRAAVGPATGPAQIPIDPNDPNLSIEQRMRLRRLQGR